MWCFNERFERINGISVLTGQLEFHVFLSSINGKRKVVLQYDLNYNANLFRAFIITSTITHPKAKYALQSGFGITKILELF